MVALVKEADAEVARFQAYLKGMIIRKVARELTLMKEEWYHQIVRSVYCLVQMLLIHKGCERTGLAKYFTMQVLANEAIVTILPDLNGDAVLADVVAPAAAVTVIRLSSSEQAFFADGVFRHVFDVFVYPIDLYRQKVVENERNARIESFYKSGPFTSDESAYSVVSATP